MSSLAPSAPLLWYSKRLLWSAVFATLGVWADFATTWYYVGHRGEEEAVWLSRWIIAHSGWAGFFVFKSLTVLVCYYISPPIGHSARFVFNLFRSQKSRKVPVAGENLQIRAVAFCALGILTFGAAAHNLEIVNLSRFFRIFGIHT